MSYSKIGVVGHYEVLGRGRASAEAEAEWVWRRYLNDGRTEAVHGSPSLEQFWTKSNEVPAWFLYEWVQELGPPAIPTLVRCTVREHPRGDARWRIFLRLQKRSRRTADRALEDPTVPVSRMLVCVSAVVACACAIAPRTCVYACVRRRNTHRRRVQARTKRPREDEVK